MALINSPREVTGIWESNKDRFLLPLFSACEIKMNQKNIESVLKELLKTDSEVGNLVELIRKTYLEKENIEVIFKLFLEICQEYPQIDLNLNTFQKYF